jgi:hypothetical protein
MDRSSGSSSNPATTPRTIAAATGVDDPDLAAGGHQLDRRVADDVDRAAAAAAQRVGQVGCLVVVEPLLDAEALTAADQGRVGVGATAAASGHAGARRLPGPRRAGPEDDRGVGRIGADVDAGVVGADVGRGRRGQDVALDRRQRRQRR